MTETFRSNAINAMWLMNVTVLWGPTRRTRPLALGEGPPHVYAETRGHRELAG